jgi:hypothetical protein
LIFIVALFSLAWIDINSIFAVEFFSENSKPFGTAYEDWVARWWDWWIGDVHKENVTNIQLEGLPFLLEGESFIWSDLQTEGMISKRPTWLDVVTNYRIFQYSMKKHGANYVALGALEDVVVMNQRRVSQSSGYAGYGRSKYHVRLTKLVIASIMTLLREGFVPDLYIRWINLFLFTSVLVFPIALVFRIMKQENKSMKTGKHVLFLRQIFTFDHYSIACQVISKCPITTL